MKEEDKNIEKEVPVVETDPAVAEAMEKMDKEIFFTAGVAKSKTTSIVKKRLEVEMVDIYEKINATIASGCYKIEKILLTQNQADFLRKKNFNLTYLNTDGNKAYYRIYWS